MSRLIIGPNAVLQVLQHHPGRIRKLYLAGNNRRADQIAAMASASNVAFNRVSRMEIEKLSGTESHQGVCAEVTSVEAGSIEDLIPADPEKTLILVLDQVQDPQNLGSLLRSAAAFGVHGVIVPKRHAVHLTPAVSKASAGASELVPLLIVSNLARALDDLKEKGMWITGLDPHAEIPIDQIPWSRPSALVLGREGSGLRRLTREKCDTLAVIPMPGEFESLGVAAAGAVALYAVSECRRNK